MQNEVDALIEVCVCLDNFIKADATSRRNNFKTTDSVLGRTVTSCDANLRQLGSLLDVPKGWTQKLKWPFKKKTVEEIIRRLGRYTALFQFSLTVEGHTVLSNTPKDVEDLLKLQVEASQKLHEITKGIDVLSATAEEHRSTAENMNSLLEGVRSLTEASDQISSIQKDVGSIKRQVTDSYDMEILEWLSPDHGRGRHYEVRSRRTPGTGKWLLNTPDFQNWLNNDSRILWLVGDPGSFVIDELKESSTETNTAIAYFYCDYRVRNTQPLAAALGGILRLLLERLENIPPVLRDIFEKSRREGRKPLPNELKEMIISVAHSFDRCFIFIDAMDEFSIADSTSTAQFTSILDEIAITSSIEVLVTSRASPSPALKSSHIVKNIHANDADISSYIAHVLQADDSLVDVLDKTLERDISETIVEQAKGMFLLAVLYLQNIQGQVTRSGVRKALKSLRGGLSEAYDKTFECIKHQSEARQKLAFDSLMWVSVSNRPMKSHELQHALATQLDDEEWDPDNIPSLRLIIRSCCGLLAVDDFDNPNSDVRLVHNTLHHYLHSQPDWMSRANILITQTSLTYLHFASEEKQQRKNEDKINFHPRLTLTPFARENWGHHARNIPPETYSEKALSLLQNPFRIRTLYPDNPRMTALHITASFGLTTLLSILLSKIPKTNSIEKIESHSYTPLHQACKNNHFDCAALLLSKGARADPLVPSITPLYTCVSNKNLALTTLLLDHGASLNSPSTDGWTALHKAADDGNLDMVKVLARRGASMSRSSARGLTALHRAAGRGHVDVLRYLLRHGARVDYTSSDGWTPLHGAAAAGRTEAVSFLLQYHATNTVVESIKRGDEYEYGADDMSKKERLAFIAGGVNFQTSSGRTALHLACQGAHVDTVEMLLSGGASVVVTDSEGDSPLHIAAREGNAVIMEVLLRGEETRMKQLNYRNGRWRTPLQEAQLSGIYEAEQMLWKMSRLSVENGRDEVDDSKVDSQSQSALEAEELVKAIRMDDADAVCGLLGGLPPERQEGQQEKIGQTDVKKLEMRNQGGRSPLQQALLFGSLNVAKMLLGLGADIHARSDPGHWTSLHYAAFSGSAEAVQLCISNGAELDSRTQQDQTPLHHACRRGAEDVVGFLLDHRADMYAIDDSKWMPVHVAAAGGHERVVRLLLERMDSAKVASHITSIQGCAASRGHHGLVELTRKWRYSWL
ncbi:hypothetical protein VI817_007948 [Penicillium citrinum]|nr:hypothetical protein VI817_007948 [Penicillium citrinum]